MRYSVMVAGGKRCGAGRRAGSGRYGMPTKAIRVPEALLPMIAELLSSSVNGHELVILGELLPLYSSTVQAGFPSPADDHIEAKLNLHQHLVKHPAATFFVRASGQSMINAGIFDGDLLIVDRSLEPLDGKIVIAAINGELTVKRLRKTAKGHFLMAENPDYPPILLRAEQDVHIWGVVTNVVHSV